MLTAIHIAKKRSPSISRKKGKTSVILDYKYIVLNPPLETIMLGAQIASRRKSRSKRDAHSSQLQRPLTYVQRGP